MTHQKFQKELHKFGLTLHLVPWGCRDSDYNLDPTIKADVDIHYDPKTHSGGAENRGSKNDFTGIFAPELLYLVEAPRKIRFHAGHAGLGNGETHIVGQAIAQIDPSQKNVWQRDKHYQPDNHKLWHLVRTFVHSSIIQRDKDDYILILDKDLNDNSLDALEVSSLDDGQFYYSDCVAVGNYGRKPNAADFTSFGEHFSLRFVQHYAKAHYHKLIADIKSDEAMNGDHMKPLMQIVSVKSIIPGIKKNNEYVSHYKRTHPRYEYNPIGYMINSEHIRHNRLILDLDRFDKGFKVCCGHSIYFALAQTIDKIHPGALKSIRQRIRRHVKHLSVTPEEAEIWSPMVFQYDETYQKYDKLLDMVQLLDGIHDDLDDLIND